MKSAYTVLVILLGISLISCKDVGEIERAAEKEREEFHRQKLRLLHELCLKAGESSEEMGQLYLDIEGTKYVCVVGGKLRMKEIDESI